MEMRQNRKDKKHPRSPGEDWTKWNPGLIIRNFLSHLTTAKLIRYIFTGTYLDHATQFFSVFRCFGQSTSQFLWPASRSNEWAHLWPAMSGCAWPQPSCFGMIKEERTTNHNRSATRLAHQIVEILQGPGALPFLLWDWRARHVFSRFG